MGLNFPQGKNNWYAIFQLKKSEIKVAGRQKISGK